MERPADDDWWRGDRGSDDDHRRLPYRDPWTRHIDPPRPRASGLGIVALAVASVALVLSWVPCVNALAVVLGLLGFKLASAAWEESVDDPAIGDTLPVAGVVVSWLALGMVVLVYVVIWLAGA